MARAAPPPAYTSSNLHKFTRGRRFYRRPLDVFLERLRRMLAATGARTMLDAGCGEGFVAAFLAAQDPALRITGLDASEGAVAYARAHFGGQARFQVGDVYALPFADDAFDAVLCSEVLEHLEDPGRAVAELKRVARGHVLITVPREPYFQALSVLGRWLRLNPDPGHVNFWTKRSFQAFIRSHFDEAVFDWVHLFQLALVPVPSGAGEQEGQASGAAAS